MITIAVAYELEPNPEHGFQELEGKLTLGPEGVAEIHQLAEEIVDTQLYALARASHYSVWRGEPEVGILLSRMLREIRSGDVTSIPASSEHLIYHEVSLPGMDIIDGLNLNLDDNPCHLSVINTATGKMICVGFGPDLPDSTQADEENRMFRYSYGFVADYRNPEEQEIKILVSTSDQTDFDEILLPQIEPPAEN